MENKKEEAIRRAYGEYWDKLFKYQQKDIVSRDGWFNCYNARRGRNESIFYEIKNNIECVYDFDNDDLIPTVIENIWNNNEWIRIESEDDLPKDRRALLWVYTDRGNIYNYFFYSTWFSINELEKVVAYQPIVKPKPPIY